MKIFNDIGLIGDFLGTIPVMVELTKKGPLEVAGLHKGIIELFHMIPREFRMTALTSEENPDYTLNLTEAFKIAAEKNLHMTQAHFAVLGLPIPEGPVRPQIEGNVELTKHLKSDYYVMSPFSRSLPDNERWPRENWQNLVDSLAPTPIFLIGSKVVDGENIDYLTGNNLRKCFGAPFTYVLPLLQKSLGLISVVTGTSHLAYAGGAKNYLFCNQGAWGKNPDAKIISPGKPIREITVEDVLKSINYATTEVNV